MISIIFIHACCGLLLWTSHLTLFNMWCTLALLILVSQAHCLMEFFGHHVNCCLRPRCTGPRIQFSVNCCNITAEKAGLLLLWGLPGRCLCTFFLQIIYYPFLYNLCTVTCQELDVLGSSPSRGKWFSLPRTRTDGPWAPPHLPYNGYQDSWPWVKVPGGGIVHPPPSSTISLPPLYACMGTIWGNLCLNLH